MYGEQIIYCDWSVIDDCTKLTGLSKAGSTKHGHTLLLFDKGRRDILILLPDNMSCERPIHDFSSQ